MEDSVEVVLHLIRRLEANNYPVNLFKGEVFCSRYDLFVDFYQDPDGNRRLFDIIQMVDGTHSVSQIADASGASFGFVLDILEKMEGHDLVRFSESPVDTPSQRAAMNG
jgi:aminopeptidase-like protein